MNFEGRECAVRDGTAGGAGDGAGVARAISYEYGPPPGPHLEGELLDLRHDLRRHLSYWRRHEVMNIYTNL